MKKNLTKNLKPFYCVLQKNFNESKILNVLFVYSALSDKQNFYACVKKKIIK